MNVTYILILLCMLNFLYVHCVRIGKLKWNGGGKKLSSDAKNSTSFVDFSWSKLGEFFGISGSRHANPWEEYMKRFDEPNNHTLSPIKDAQFGEWDGNKGICEILKEKKINYTQSKTEKNAAECGKELLNLTKTVTNEKSKKNEYYLANWDPTKKCLIYKAKSNCLLYKSGGYAFISTGTVNTEVYDLPPCIDGFINQKIQAKCGTDNNEKTFQCNQNNWVAENTKFIECLKSTIENEQKETEGTTGKPKENDTETEETERNTEQTERSTGQTERNTRQIQTNVTETQIDAAKTQIVSDKTQTDAAKIQKDAAETDEKSKVAEQAEEEEGAEGEDGVEEEKGAEGEKGTEGEKGAEGAEGAGSGIKTEKTRRAVSGEEESEETQKPEKETIKTAQVEQKEKDIQPNNTTIDKLNQPTDKTDEHETQAKTKINQTELNDADKLPHNKSNITTSSAQRYRLALTAVVVTFVFVFGTFIL